MSKNTNEELVELIQNKANDSDQDEYLTVLYQQNYPFIRKLCRRYAAFDDIDDLTQEAFFGFRIAAERYDPSKSSSFISYASYWIIQAISSYLNNCGSIMRLPANLRDRIIKYHAVYNAYVRDHGTEPSDEDLCMMLDINREQLQRLKPYTNILQNASLDEVIGSEDDSFTLGDTLADPSDRYEDLSDQLDDDILRRVLWAEVDALDDKQAEIIHKRFKYNMSLSETADYMGLSPEGVRYVQTRALSRLRQSNRIRLYAEDYLSRAYSGTGLTSFRNNGTSATERTAIEHYESELNKHIREIERSIKRIEKKFNIKLDDGFRQQKMEEYKDRIESVNI